MMEVLEVATVELDNSGLAEERVLKAFIYLRVAHES